MALTPNTSFGRNSECPAEIGDARCRKSIQSFLISLYLLKAKAVGKHRSVCSTEGNEARLYRLPQQLHVGSNSISCPTLITLMSQIDLSIAIAAGPAWPRFISARATVITR